MEALKALFLTYAYPPQKYPRSVQISLLVQYLRNEFSLEIVTSHSEVIEDPSLLGFTPFDNVHYAEKSTLTRLIEIAKGYRIKKALLPDFHYPWHFDLYKKADEMIQRHGADVIVTFGQPMSTHIAGLKLKKKFPHLKWVAHFSDPWIDNIFNDYNAWVKLINKYYQNAVFHNADKLIFTSEETIDLVALPYTTEIRSKMLYLPHAFNENLYTQEESQRQTKKLLNIRYIGNFYGDRQPDCLFNALKVVPQSLLENIKIELVGSITTDIQHLIKKLGLEKTIYIISSVSYRDSLALMQESDLLLVIDAPTETSPFLPSKLIDYIGANKPIFGITPSGTSQRVIEEMGFLTADPRSLDEIVRKLSQMIQHLKNGKRQEVPEHIRARYSIKTIGSQMSNILKNVI